MVGEVNKPSPNEAVSFPYSQSKMNRALGRVVRSPHDFIELPLAPIGQFLRFSPSKPTLICADTGQALNGDSVERLSGAVGNWALGVGSPVATLLPNSLRLALTALGALRAGVPLAPAHPDLTPTEISRLLITTGARCVVTTSFRVPGVLAGMEIVERTLGTQYPLEIVTADNEMAFSGVRALDDILTGQPSCLPLPSSDVTALLLESGGHIVRLSQANILANCLQVSTTCPLKEDSAVAAILPIFNGYGLIHVLVNSLINGARIITMSRYQPKAIENAVEKYGINVLPTASDMMSGISNSSLSQLDTLVVHIPPPGRPKLPPLPPNLRLLTLHGLPSGPVLFHCGRPLPNTEIKVIDEKTGEELGPGMEGRLWASGPQLSSSSWTVTSDIGKYDESGKFEVTGHTGDSLYLHGLIIDPAEIESVLSSHPDVADAGVYSESGSRETASAVLVPRNPSNPPDLRGLRHFISSRLAPHKHISEIRFAAEIPRLPDGRTDRKALAKLKKEKEFVAMSFI